MKKLYFIFKVDTLCIVKTTYTYDILNHSLISVFDLEVHFSVIISESDHDFSTRIRQRIHTEYPSRVMVTTNGQIYPGS